MVWRVWAAPSRQCVELRDLGLGRDKIRDEMVKLLASEAPHAWWDRVLLLAIGISNGKQENRTAKMTGKMGRIIGAVGCR